MSAGALPVALTMGEPAGVGGEIALKAWLRTRAEAGPGFFVVDDPDRLARIARELDLDVPVAEIDDPRAGDFARALPVIPMPLSGPTKPGTPSPANAPAVVASIERAVGLVLAGKAAAVVTNPVHKETLYACGFPHPGHTEFLAELARRHTGKRVRPVMMLAGGDLRVVPVTVHVPLRDVAAALNSETIIACGRTAAAALACDFGITRPRLAVAGLNPHAGEGGAIGTEDRDVVAPAVAELCKLGIAARGPLAADTLFHAEARAGYDAALCMYHDQALIPIKTVAFESAVNVTLGLPFVRTSPDHGTALDIAGTGRARESSLLAALAMASDMARRRAAADGRSRVA